MITHLHTRGILKLGGAEARPFLQRLITQDVLEGDAVRYGALLNAKGKYLYDLFIWVKDDDIYVDSERVDALEKLLNMYKLRSDVTIQNVSNLFKVFALDHMYESSDFISQPDPRHQAMGYRLITAESLEATNALDTYDALRLPLNIADGSRDMTIDKSLLMDFNFDTHHGINWQKGCYVGQENTNRSRRPELRRRQFMGLVSESESHQKIERGDALVNENQEVGHICSVCYHGDKIYIGSLLNLEYATQNQVLSCQGLNFSHSFFNGVTG